MGIKAQAGFCEVALAMAVPPRLESALKASAQGYLPAELFEYAHR